MIRNEHNPGNSVLPFLISPLTEPRGQIKFCKNFPFLMLKSKDKFLITISKVYVVSHHNMESTQ